MPVRVLGVDPGLAKFGFVLVDVFQDHEEVVEVGLVSTEKSGKKRRVLASDDNVRRGREIAKVLLDTRFQAVRVVCAEAMSFVRNASAAAKTAISWGVLIAFTTRHGLPLVQASPQEIKQAVCGSKSASKEEVQAKLLEKYENAAVQEFMRTVAKSKYEHGFDSIGAVVACLGSEVLRMVRGM